MSNLVTTMCRPLQMSGPQKAVLMCIADYAHDDGRDWHSIAAIGEWTCLGRTTVIDALKWLEEAGILSIEKVSGRNNRTVINLSKVESLASDQSASRTSPPAVPVREPDHTRPPAVLVPVRQPDHTRPPAVPEALEASLKHQKHQREDHFEEFWKAYPKKVGKDAARSAFEKRKPSRELVDAMLAAIGAAARSDQWQRDKGQFIPNPATWLNEGRWQDEGVAIPSVVSAPAGKDPALLEIIASRQLAAPMPASIRHLAARLGGQRFSAAKAEAVSAAEQRPEPLSAASGC